MVQFKAWEYYINFYLEDTYKFKKGIDYIMAISTFLSLVLWNVIGILSYICLAASLACQFIELYRHKLPFDKVIKNLTPFCNEIASLCNKADYNWMSINRNNLDDEDINKLIFDMNQECLTIQTKYLSTIIVEDKRKMKKANDKADKYFRWLFNIEEVIPEKNWEVKNNAG